jgi:hypothetical protein
MPFTAIPVRFPALLRRPPPIPFSFLFPASADGESSIRIFLCLVPVWRIYVEKKILMDDCSRFGAYTNPFFSTTVSFCSGSRPVKI